MKKFAPFLKLYTEYVKNFEAANNLVTQWAEKSNKFAAFLKEVQVRPDLTVLYHSEQLPPLTISLECHHNINNEYLHYRLVQSMEG